MARTKKPDSPEAANPPRKRRKYKPRSRRNPQSAQPLPAPVEVQSAQPESPEPSPNLFGLGNLFGSPQSLASAPALASPESSTANYGEGAPDEQLLSRVPEVIGDDPATEGARPGVPEALDPVAGLMAMVAFEEQDVRETLAEFFDWMAERFKSDHWKLNERQARMLGKPGTLLANALWAKLQAYLPEVLGKWCETTPGALAFLTACGIVIGPKVMQQMQISKRRAAEVSIVREGASHGPQVAKEPTARGVIWSEGGDA